MMKEHQSDLEELRKELIERDERIDELHVEYKAEIQVNIFYVNILCSIL